MKQHDAYAVWRLPSFRRYFTGNMILILGWQMQKVAIGWEIYERTHSAMALGYAGLAQFLPQVVFMLIAGHVTDRHNRKSVLMLALAANGLAAAGLALNAAMGGSIYVLYACLFAYGTALLDNALLEPLAKACVEENRDEFMLFISPLPVSGGTGSPANPIAVF